MRKKFCYFTVILWVSALYFWWWCVLFNCLLVISRIFIVVAN